ncbi:MAG: Cytochrome biosis protein transrane region [Acidobacteria bacterium]|nr:Cytochrome biosis protein transrane region [Acidobacteriota bacterium]
MESLTALLQSVSLQQLSLLSLLVAFVAGVLSFISPCVLPLIPGYISFISGATLEQMRGRAPGAPAQAGAGVAAAAASGTSRRVLATSLAFVLGFSLVFVAFGATASAIGQLLGSHKAKIAYLAGALLIVLGLHMTGVFRIGFLDYEKRAQASKRPAGLLGAGLVGVAFAFGWTPCIGPILGGILTIAGSQESVAQGVLLLAAYSLGLGVPFLLTAAAINKFFAAFARIRRHYRAIEVVSGVLLIGIGVLMLLNRMTAITNVLQRYLPSI